MSQNYPEDRRVSQRPVEEDKREYPYEYKNEKKPGFIQVTWKEIVAATISFLIIGAVGFVFTNFNSRLSSVEELTLVEKSRGEKIELLMEAELRESIRNLKRELEERTDDLSTNSNLIRSLERTVTRLEVLLESGR